MKVHVLEENNVSMDLEFSIRETTCRRDSGVDPTTCDFQRGYYVVSVVRRATPIPEMNMRQRLVFFHDVGLVWCHTESLATACRLATLGGTKCPCCSPCVAAVCPSG